MQASDIFNSQAPARYSGITGRPLQSASYSAANWPRAIEQHEANRGGIYRYLGTYPTDAYLVGAFMTPLEHDTDPIDSRGRDYRANDHSFPCTGVAKVRIHVGELRTHCQMLPEVPDR